MSNELYCKWVSDNMTTRNNTKWKVGVPNELPEKDDLELCEEGLFHCFSHPLLAALLKTTYGCGHYTKLYEVVPEGKIVEGLDRCGATKLTLIKQLEIPKVTRAQRVAFGILCAKEVYKEPKFVDWADKWLSGEDRSQESAEAVVDAVEKIHHNSYDFALRDATRCSIHAASYSEDFSCPSDLMMCIFAANSFINQINEDKISFIHLILLCLFIVSAFAFVSCIIFNLGVVGFVASISIILIASVLAYGYISRIKQSKLSLDLIPIAHKAMKVQ